MNIMMILGPIRFAVDAAAYSDFKRKAEYRWPIMERLGRRVAHQFIGIGSDIINLKGTIYPGYDPYGNGGFRIGIFRVEEMRKLAEQGIPMEMITGYGEALGRYCIKSVEETQTVFFENGSFRKQEFEMELTLYGEDSIGFDGIVFMGGAFVVPRLQVNASVSPNGLNIGGSLSVGG